MPCVLFEDDDLVVVNKPAGIGTHRAAEEAPWGIAELLQSRRPALARLGIHQRLDRPTSGVMLFAKSARANVSLAGQFEKRRVRKTYLFATRGSNPKTEFTAREPVEGKGAETRFRRAEALGGGLQLWEAEPATGRTHQVRLHAAVHGLPIEGDAEPLAIHDSRFTSHVSHSAFRVPTSAPAGPLLLHAAKLELDHPADGRPLVLEAPLPEAFRAKDEEGRRVQAALALRRLLIEPDETEIFRLIHRAGDGFPLLTVDRLGGWLYAEDFGEDAAAATAFLDRLANTLGDVQGIILSRAAQGQRREDKRLVAGRPPPADFTALENGVRFRLDPLAPGGTGLFLDQRENRRRLMRLAEGRTMLNLFAYTCGFSVAAARGGAAATVSVDLSRPALEWGRRNFEANALELARHRFLARDAAEAFRGLAAREERFGAIVIDPPSFSRNKSGGAFSARRDFEGLARSAVSRMEPGGWLLCSTNLAAWKAADFAAAITRGVRVAGREIAEKLWMPQPFDFPVTPNCPAHFKSLWLRLG